MAACAAWLPQPPPPSPPSGASRGGTWGCPVSKFDWSYSEDETCYLLEGDVVVTDNKTGATMRVKAGDVAFFPQGMKCVWDVSVPIQKHFSFGTGLSALE